MLFVVRMALARISLPHNNDYSNTTPSIMEEETTPRPEQDGSRRWHGNATAELVWGGFPRRLLAGMAVLIALVILSSVDSPRNVHRNAYGGANLGGLRLGLDSGEEEPTRTIRGRENVRAGSASGSASSANVAFVSSPSKYEPRCSTKKELSETIHNNHNHNSNNYDSDPYEAPEPFRYLHDCCEDCNPPVPESPDPMVSVTWNNIAQSTTAATKDSPSPFVGTPLQIYRTRDPVRLYTIPANASVIVNSPPPPPPQGRRTKSTSTSTVTRSTPRIIVLENCTVVMDWGSERAAWFEVWMPSYNEDGDDTVRVRASVSEYNRPYPGKTRALTRYGNSTYRLETNDELYEGVRFTFLHVSFPHHHQHQQALEIDDFSLVSKIKPLAYTSRFQSSNPLLIKAWYWGAYGVRLNVQRDQLNSILIERGDRVAIQGDGHPTIATVLSVFYQTETKHLLQNVLNDTDSAHKRVVDDNIMAYPLYWCLSAMDYYWATGGGSSRSSNSSSSDDDDDDQRDDAAAFVDQLVEDIRVLLDRRIADFLDPHLDITWFGWDDRVGNGWCFHAKDDACTREGLLAFAGLVIRVCNDFCHVLQSLVADPSRSAPDRDQFQALLGDYREHSQNMTQALRNVEEFPAGFGVHAAAYAINARVATRDEIADSWMGTQPGTDTLNNAVTICSFSQFNQYWILQAFGNLQGMGLEHALKSIELCWGPMMELSTGGCFWELSSPEWLTFLEEGDQAPHLPSYCHPWASGVTPWLSRLVAGTAPLTPGYPQYLSMPYVSQTHPTVASTTATPRGNIVVTARLSPPVLDKNNRLRYDFQATLSATTDGVFGVPKSILAQPSSEYELESQGKEVFLRMESITVVNSRLHSTVPTNRWEAHEIARMFPASRLADNPRSNDYVFLVLERSEHEDDDDDDDGNDGTTYVITAEFETTIRSKSLSPAHGTGHGNDARRGGATAPLHRSLLAKDVAPFPVPEYPASVALDAQRQGDGLFVYGTDGYALMGFNDTDALPSYVQNLRIRQHGFPGWVIPQEEWVGYSTDDPVYLPVGTKRVLGTVGIDDQGGGDINCILVDVQLTTATEATDGGASPPPSHNNSNETYYYLSIYFVASRMGNKHAIRVMDGDTYDVIAPTTLMEDYTEGIWWTLKTNRRSVRLKLLDIQGIHLSAVAFSTELPTIQ